MPMLGTMRQIYSSMGTRSVYFLFQRIIKNYNYVASLSDFHLTSGETMDSLGVSSVAGSIFSTSIHSLPSIYNSL